MKNCQNCAGSPLGRFGVMPPRIGSGAPSPVPSSESYWEGRANAIGAGVSCVFIDLRGHSYTGKVPRYRRKSSYGVKVKPRTSIAFLLSTHVDLKSTHVDIRIYARG